MARQLLIGEVVVDSRRELTGLSVPVRSARHPGYGFLVPVSPEYGLTFPLVLQLFSFELSGEVL